MLSLRPAVLRGDATFEFPRPVLVCRIHDRWDYLRMKVPLRQGDQVAGASQDGVDITIEGQIGSHAGALALTEEAMFDALLALRAALQPDEEDGYSLALLRAGDDGPTRCFRHCTTSRCDLDLSNRQLYSYAVSIHAADPAVYES